MPGCYCIVATLQALASVRHVQQHDGKVVPEDLQGLLVKCQLVPASIASQEPADFSSWPPFILPDRPESRCDLPAAAHCNLLEAAT